MPCNCNANKESPVASHLNQFDPSVICQPNHEFIDEETLHPNFPSHIDSYPLNIATIATVPVTSAPSNSESSTNFATSILHARTMAEYSSLKVPELKKLLAEKGMSQTGNKADLIARLQEEDKKGESEAKPGTSDLI